MSNSNAAAIRRRATIQNNQPNTPSMPGKVGQSNMPPAPPVNTQELTLPQVIALIDKRLVALEKHAKESSSSLSNEGDVQYASVIELNTVITEFNHRFELLAMEINTMKDMLLKLQSFTMDVNKMLLNERIHVLSDLGGGENKTMFQLSQLENDSIDEQEAGMILREMSKQDSIVEELVFSSTSV